MTPLWPIWADDGQPKYDGLGLAGFQALGVSSYYVCDLRQNEDIPFLQSELE